MITRISSTRRTISAASVFTIQAAVARRHFNPAKCASDIFHCERVLQNGGSVAEVQEKNCTEFLSRKGPIKIPSGILLSSLKRIMPDQL